MEDVDIVPHASRLGALRVRLAGAGEWIAAREARAGASVETAS